MYRNKSFDEHLAKELKSSKFAGGFLLDLMDGDDGFTLEEALRQTIQRMGVKEFCVKARLDMPNVMKFLKGTRKLKPETLDVFLKPFGLRTKLIVEKAS